MSPRRSRPVGHHLDRPPVLLQLRADAGLPQVSDGARARPCARSPSAPCGGSGGRRGLTFVFGLLIISVQDMEDGAYFSGQRGPAILTGMLFGLTMFLNVWGVIWRPEGDTARRRPSPRRRADPRAPAAGQEGPGRRRSTFFSITMLFFMVFAAPQAGFWGRRGPPWSVVPSSTGSSCWSCGLFVELCGARAHRWPRRRVQQGRLRRPPAHDHLRLRLPGGHLLHRLGAAASPGGVITRR